MSDVIRRLEIAFDALQADIQSMGKLIEEAVAAELVPLDDAPELPGLVPPPADPVQRMSAQGREFLMHLEGVELQPYRDVAGIWTIGVGHVIRDGEDHLRNGITREVAMSLLAEDVQWAEECVRGLELPRPLAQHQFDALVCFAFNVGAGAFRGSTMARRLKSGDYSCVPSELMRWRYITMADGRKKVSTGLVNRRRQTGELWTRADYTVTW